MAEDRIQAEPNPSRREEPARPAARSAVSFMLEGVGLFGTLGSLVAGAVGAVSALGTTLFIPSLVWFGGAWVAGPVVFGLAGAGAGALAGGFLGALVGLARAVSRPGE
ncbi:MAG: hypothetical protein K2W96_06295 [Gemmataceae bacterium]|nr:hypothetical protein [Gemmataceae bacterium]